jgi:hypothetical protein
MKRIVTAAVGLTMAVVASGSVLAGGASAAGTPPWEPDGDSVGGLTFYNASGTAITTGSTSDPIAAFVQGAATVHAGDTKATLFGYLPATGVDPGAWSGEALGASTSYPNASAPGSLGTSSLPVYSTGADDETVADLVADYPNTSSDPDYQGIYQIRLLTSAPGQGISAVYDSADIVVSGGTWSLLYTAGTATPTTTSLAVSPSGSATHGDKVKLTATVSPAAATGNVTFRDNGTVLKTVAVSGGTAKLKTSSLSVGKHSLTAKFIPDSSTYAISMSAVKKVKIKAEPTKTVLKASKTKVSVGTKIKLKAIEKPKVAGKITFLDGSKKLAKPVKVKAGKAKLKVALKKGTHKIKAKFTPKKSTGAASSTSKTVKVTVKG